MHGVIEAVCDSYNYDRSVILLLLKGEPALKQK